ncbi:nuclear transport factor 2 family protein [Sulfitobacter albidus]|uniref:Nuclear transport factor 2 family protein n=1 Tax=Sulfitobacter albidus TaxID=2829501 RepID=A0A975PNI9_9RHOB|nr:nuclear transport factor 2 family protein [Sulfitobacter albidus]QUJ77898.1 nuclear transport factor 2 family protein [Sulfitobacter albidus]
MDLKEIAAELVAGCREGRERANLDTLYAADAVSAEPNDRDGQSRITQGRDAIKAKHDWFDSAMTDVQVETSDPMLHGDDRFAVRFYGTMKDAQSGEIYPMDEVAIYHVADGKIVREEFFYNE